MFVLLGLIGLFALTSGCESRKVAPDVFYDAEQAEQLRKDLDGMAR